LDSLLCFVIQQHTLTWNMYFHFHNFTLPPLVHTIFSIPHRQAKQGPHCKSTQLRGDWHYETNHKLPVSLILRKIIKNVICHFIMSVSLDLQCTSVFPPCKSCCLISGSATPKWNTLQHAACLRLSVASFMTIFVKIIFTHKSFLKIHLTVS